MSRWQYNCFSPWFGFHIHSQFSHFLQLEVADKQLKCDRKFLDDQTTEREQERDEFTKEIEKLRAQLKERDKERTAYDRTEKEVNTNFFTVMHVHKSTHNHINIAFLWSDTSPTKITNHTL